MKKLFTLFIFLCAALSSSADEDTTTWYLSASEGLTDYEWGIHEKNIMAETSKGSGIYAITLESVAAGTYEFKVTNSDWTTYYPSNNYSFYLAEASDVTIVCNPSTGYVFAYPHSDWHVVGSSDIMPNNWSLSDGTMTYDEDNMLFSYTLSNKSLAVGCYEYNFYYNTNGFKNWSYKKQSYITIQNKDNTNNSMVAIATAGTYDITFYYDPIEDRGWCEPKMTNARDSYTIYVESEVCPRIYIWGNNATKYEAKPHYTNWEKNGTGLVGLPMECKKKVGDKTYWTTTFYNFDGEDGLSWLLYNNGSQSGNMWTNGDEYCFYNGVNTITFYPQLVIGTDGCWTHGKVFPQVDNDYTITETIPAYTQFLVKKGNTWYPPTSNTNVRHRTYEVSSGNSWATFTTPLNRSYTITWSSDLSKLKVDYDDYALDYFTATEDGEYNAATHTLKAINNGHWDGITLWVGDVSTTQNDFAVIQTNAAVKLGWWMGYTTGDDVGKNETTASTIHYCPLDADRVLKSLTISLQEAGTVKFSNLSFVDAVARAELKTAAGGYATFSSNEDVAIPEGITAKYPSEVTSAGAITWVPFANGIPANQGALLEGTAGTTYKFPPAVESPSTVPDEAKTTVTMEPIATKDLLQQENNGYTKYILSKQSPDSDVVGFFKVNYSSGSWVNAGTAYLKVNNNAFLGAPAFFPLTGETTAIDNLTTEPAAKGEEKIYSLDGRRIVGQPTAKGIYIVNGKKLLKK